MQRALTCLVLGDEPPGWSRPATSTPLGRRSIDRLDLLAHGSTHDGDATFVDEHVDLLYVMPPVSNPDPVVPDGGRYRHVDWPQVAELRRADVDRTGRRSRTRS